MLMRRGVLVALHTRLLSTGSLVDTFGRNHDYLRISLTERCNLRCFYCMPEEGVQLTPKSNLLTTSEIISLARMFVQTFGVKKIRLTGGEPTIRKDLVDIVGELSQLRSLGLEKIGMTTNGIVFHKYSQQLRDAGLDSVNISLDTLKEERFERITRRNGLRAVLQSIESALVHKFDTVKVNCVPIRGVNDDEFDDFVELTRNTTLEIRFIEYMPFDGNRWNFDKMIPNSEVLEHIRVKHPRIEQLKPISVNETSRMYRVPFYRGSVGFISSMSAAFCGGCNRVRITADGHLKVCLFGQDEVSLKQALRDQLSDEQMHHLIVDAVRRKKQHHAGALNIARHSNRPMILIAARNFSTQPGDHLSHVDSKSGQARMVNVGSKCETLRMARARARVQVTPAILVAIEKNEMTKGNVLTVAQVAGIQASKQTHHLVPMCHQIGMNHVNIHIVIDSNCNELVVECTAEAIARTGVEMEALTGVTVAALTIYDMCKSMDKSIVIKEIKLIEKLGGKSGHFHCES